MKGRLPWKIQVAAFLGIAVAFTAAGRIPGGNTACGKPWIFFDLGNTLINSHPGQEFRYLPGAHEYIRELRRRGAHIGLITNIPEKWGPTRASRIRILKKMVAESWTKDETAEAMDWTDFPDSTIIIPYGDAYRKPGPHMFLAALDQVSLEEGTGKCHVIFEGEDPVEVNAAVRAGMIGYTVWENLSAPYLPINRLETP